MDGHALRLSFSALGFELADAPLACRGAIKNHATSTKMAPTLSNTQKVGIALLALIFVDEKRKKRRVWTKSLLRERLILNEKNDLLDFDDIQNCLRMEKKTFYELLEMVRPMIEKKDTNMRRAVSAEERLTVTLRFLATGRKYSDHKDNKQIISHQSLSQIIPETCRAIYRVLKKIIKLPSTEDGWKMSAQSFEQQWQFNNCVGCLEGKHILIHNPPNRSQYFNYKGTFSVILFAIVNANYEFIYIHTGSNGSMTDGGLTKNTRFYEKLMKKELRLPESYLLPDTDISVPYVFLGDNPFALDTHIMKPFEERNMTNEKKIFNYRLSRARRVAENAFGILGSRFGVFRRPMNLKLENVDAVVFACCALHNFLMKKSKTYLTSTCVDREDIQNFTFSNGTWRQATDQLTPFKKNIPSEVSNLNDGDQIRNVLTEYFNGVGRVSFQDRMASVIDFN